MKLRTAFALLPLLTACGLAQPPHGPAAPKQDGPGYVMPQEEQAMVRKNEQAAYAQADEAMDEQTAKLETKALKAIKVALGKESTYQGMPVPESSSTVLRALKSGKIKARLEPVTDGEGNAVNGDFLAVKDSYTDRVQALSRKIAEQKATKAEMKEVQAGAKYAMKLNDLRQQVNALSMATMDANWAVTSESLSTMLRVSGIVRTRKLLTMELDATDYETVRRALARQRRTEAIAATTIAMMAAYQAVLNDKGDPKALDVIGEAALSAFPMKVDVTEKDAKDYVAALGDNVAKAKARYEQMLRKTHGDAKYEKSYKASIDGMFAQAENAQKQKSVNEIAKEHFDQFTADVAKCKTGIDPEAEARIGPSCKESFRAAQTGDTSHLLPGTKQAFDKTPTPAPSPAGAKLGARETAALEGISAAANGDADGMLDAAGKMFPGDSQIGASLQGISALKKGDAKGAIKAALTFVPVPGLKDAFGIASKLFG